MRSLTTAAIEFAAAESLPMCPMIAVYEVNPIPHKRELPSTGSVYFQKSYSSAESKEKIFFNFSFIFS